MGALDELLYGGNAYSPDGEQMERNALASSPQRVPAQFMQRAGDGYASMQATEPGVGLFQMEGGAPRYVDIGYRSRPAEDTEMSAGYAAAYSPVQDKPRYVTTTQQAEEDWFDPRSSGEMRRDRMAMFKYQNALDDFNSGRARRRPEPPPLIIDKVYGGMRRNQRTTTTAPERDSTADAARIRAESRREEDARKAEEAQKKRDFQKQMAEDSRAFTALQTKTTQAFESGKMSRELAAQLTRDWTKIANDYALAAVEQYSEERRNALKALEAAARDQAAALQQQFAQGVQQQGAGFTTQDATAQEQSAAKARDYMKGLIGGP